MSRRKKITIIISAIILVLVGLLIFLEFGEPTTPGPSPEEEDPIFPFATTSDRFFTRDGQRPTTTITREDQPAGQRPDLWKISDDPVAESRWVQPAGQAGQKIWFVKQASGSVFSANPQTREVTRLSSSTIPQVREAFLGQGGNTVVYRYVNDNEVIQTYVADLVRADNPDFRYRIDGSFLPTDIYAMDISPSGDRVFYLRETDNRKSVGIVYNLRSKQGRQVFSSDVSQWRLRFDQPQAVTLYTPAADTARGFAYELDLDTGRLQKITDGVGLTAHANQTGNSVLVTNQGAESAVTQVLSLPDYERSFAVSTFADKCQWERKDIFLCGVPTQNSASSITGWYQGKINFTDNIVIFNTGSSNRDSLLDEDEVDKASADIDDLGANEQLNHLFFTDRTSGDLWGLDL